jgi:hypothetical protein
MTSTEDNREAIPGFWKDWFTRIGVGIWVAVFIGLLIHGLLASMGLIRPLKGVTIQDLEAFEAHMYPYAIYPGFIGLVLVLIGAVRTLRRKKIFP